MLLLLLAAVAGYVLGGLADVASYEEELTALQRVSRGEGDEARDAGAAAARRPLGLWISALPGADPVAVQEQLRLAADAGVHLCVVAVPAPAPDRSDDGAALREAMEWLLQANPRARVMLRLPLDMTVEWLSGHPDACVYLDGVAHAEPCIASETWRNAAADVLRAAVAMANEYGWPIEGYVLECLEGGRWVRTGPDDSGPANTAGFRRWLHERYGTDDNLRIAWERPEASLAAAQIPVVSGVGADEADDDAEEDGGEATDEPDAVGSDPAAALYTDRATQPVVDYRRYTAIAAAEAIAGLAQALREEIAPEQRILVRYGHTFDAAPGGSQHAALSVLWRSAIDGFISPVSYHDRGLGGTGGFMGPIHSALRHGKSWHLIDDTRTGIARDSVTGEITQLKGLRIEDVYAVQARNYGAALANGIGLLWADSDGTGALLDKAMWTRFGAMADLYTDTWPQPAWGMPPPETRTTLCVVVDELSRAYQRDYPDLSEDLLYRARDAALSAGVPTAFCLLGDLVEGVAPDAAAYLFLNAFHLNESRRNAVHGWLRDHRAAAIWMYAPGVLGSGGMEAGIEATTGFPVRRVAQPAYSGSLGALGTPLIPNGAPIGLVRELDPLFSIDVEKDDEAAVLAKYADSDRASIAMRFRPDGWASIYCAEPGITPNVLRQVLSILEERIYIESNPDQAPDAAHFGPNLIAIHGRGQADRERRLSLPGVFDVTDLLNPELGWPAKHSFAFPVRFGETFILKLTPVPQSAPPSDPDAPLDDPEAVVDPVPEDAAPPTEDPDDLPDVLP